MPSESDYLRRQAEEVAMRTREQAHRAFYYFNPGARTLAEYVAEVHAQELFDDS